MNEPSNVPASSDLPDPHCALVERVLMNLFPRTVVVRALRPGLYRDTYPEEWEIVSRAVPRRRREFSAGRAAARKALAAVGIRSSPLLSGPLGAPVWPSKVTGSIAHSARFSVAAIARSSESLAIGLDLEEADPIPPALVDQVCRAEEKARLEQWRQQLDTDAAKLIFSAKEACYKAYQPVTRHFMDFEDLEIDLLPEQGAFIARMKDAAAPALLGRRSWLGRFTRVAEHVACTVEVPVTR